MRAVRRARSVAAVAAVGVLAVIGLALARGGDARERAQSPVARASAGGAKACFATGGAAIYVEQGARCPPPVHVASDGAASAGPRTAPARPNRADAAPSATAGISLRRAVGAKIMTGMIGTFPDADLLRRVRRGEVGAVILFGPNLSPQLPAAVAALRRAAASGGGRILVATDQEGGPVRRLTDAPPSRSAADMGRAGVVTAERSGLAAAQALRGAGIDVDLAPVADVQAPGGFLGSRSFGTDPAAVAQSACGFARGLRRGHVAATLKHFPGLGRALANTDERAVTVSASRSALLADLAPYRACAASADLVMVSNATYRALDPNDPAVFSSRVVTDLLRGALRFGGVTISDTLAAPGVQRGDAAVRASRAGVDMLLYTDEQLSARAYDELVAATRGGELGRSRVIASASRIATLQRHLADG